MGDLGNLTVKQRAYVQGLAQGLPARQAAKAAGFSSSYSLVAAQRLSKKPAVQRELERIRAEGREQAVYGMVEAMAEAESAAQFAKANKNAMAYVKAVELRAKISGLMVERIEQVPPINLRQALEDAKARVLNITPSRRELGPALSLPGPTPSSRGPSMNE